MDRAAVSEAANGSSNLPGSTTLSGRVRSSGRPALVAAGVRDRGIRFGKWGRFVGRVLRCSIYWAGLVVAARLGGFSPGALTLLA